MHGLIQLPWWGYVVLTLVLTQITILGVTIFLHRCQAHRALDLHPIVSHFFRFWLWMTTGMITKQWTAIHRKHHAKVETAEDPHSPQIKGLRKVWMEGAELYKKEGRNKVTMERYGEGTPDDWIEQHLYTPHSAMGITILLILNISLFGLLGLTIWAIQMAWIPFFAAGIVNGVGHYYGYRNFECQDASRNIIPIGFFIGGEELHNNHHTYGTSARFSVKWWEFDMGWFVIRLLQMIGLATPKKVPPKTQLAQDKGVVDIDTIKAIFTNRFQVLATYTKDVVLPVLRDERQRAGDKSRALCRRVRTLLVREPSLIDQNGQKRLATVFEHHVPLNVVYQLRIKLQNIWAKSTASQAELVDALQEWCRQAEATGIKALRDFVKYIKAHVPHRA
jgi:stearoyl-CoA desaturase (delta-9 desaturase)